MNPSPFRRVAVGAIVSLSLVLTACSGGNTESASDLSDKPVTIRATWWGADARAQLTDEVIKAFEKKYPNITVKGQYKDWNGYWDALATTTAAKDSPDVVQMDELYLASYAGRGALYDLGKAKKLLSTSQFDDQALATGQVDGTQYALPVGVGVMSILVNTDLFKKYGVKVPDDKTWTWDDYAKIGKELTDKSGGKIHGAAGAPGFSAGDVKYWARQHGENLFDKDGNVSLKPETLAGMWKYGLDLTSSGASVKASTMVEDLTAGVTAGSFATGKAAMMGAYNTQITAIQQAAGAQVKLLQMPRVGSTKANFFKPSMYWAVSSQSKHPAEAAAFINFMLNDPKAADILKTERGIPANKAMLKHLQPGLAGTDKAAADYQKAVTPGESPVVTPNGGSGIEPELQRYSQEVYFKKTSPEAAAKAFVKELQGEIDAAK
ncbi:sugar ABC transporter substrate-binding protein [Streptomyces sp. NEAU-H22]|uniref:ABC transporter substrate-binding protein n=1 Tax=unclassified Streptomyces TaxID=2593676 RepID=UPI0022501465|nr:MULTISPECIES: sugar ABC transporter substrate-binding protein [unclassified Streptomyces]MCX3291868.1 sugar ABC transporter substrate-binding protein [Streptomyces sp. NEAU-H22]WMD06919.1 sugar ABC transporter substrate-binding protein [Streptomyces sp. FXY-T5]